MGQTGGNYPESVATWEIDEETGEAEELGSYTNWE